MDDFNGEVSCTEVLGIKPGEQATDTQLSALCLWRVVCVRVCRGGTPFLSVRVSLWSVFRTPLPCCPNSPKLTALALAC